jgi:SWI/SNF-related matrix-associated actin-dependent regulator 1 of chromatin subfamily A
MTRTATMAENQYGERVIKIVFPFSYDDLEKVRSLPGRKFHSDTKCWSAPVQADSINNLVKWGFTIDEKLQTFVGAATAKKIQSYKPNDVKGLKGEPYPFQKVGITFADTNEGRILNADDMGLGKTIQALGYIQLHRDRTPAIIICPASLKLNWERECHKWLPNPSVEVLSGERTWTPTAEILIINYDVVPHWKDVLRKLNPQILIMDEAHAIKNHKAKRTKAVQFIGKKIPHIIALTGTPIENRPAEIYNAVHMINPELFPNRWFFMQRYCGAKFNGYGWSFNGATNMQELHQILSDNIMIRRKKKDVLKDLPDKTRSFVPIELSNRNEYIIAEDDFIAYVQRTKGHTAAVKASNAEAFAQIEGLKQLAVKGKLDQAICWIKEFIESGEKLIVFATHTFVIDALMKEFPGIIVKVDGSVSGNQRQVAVDKFQNDPSIKLFVGNIKAAGVGITLTAASNVAFLEYPWTPSQLDQAEDRAHRIGQKNAVNIYYLLASNTIEEKMVKMIDSKRKIIDSVIDGVETDEASLLSELLKSYI